MEGSITKRKDGRWQGVVDIPNIIGKRERKYVYAATRPECRRKVNELIEQIESGSILSPSKLTFEEYAQKWLDVYCANLSPTTIAGYKKSIKTYASKYIGPAIISKILPIHIQEMINDLAKNHKEKTLKNTARDVSAVFKYAIKNKIIKTNPCGDVVIPKDIEEFEYYIYNEDEFNHLLDLTEGTEHEIPILLAALCGLRASEVMGLQWHNIDFDTNVISIEKACVRVGAIIHEKNTKTRSSKRKVVAPAYVIERLKLYRGIGYVICKKDGTPENGANYSRRFGKFLIKHNLPHTRFHDLRHFNATQMLKLGIPDKEAAARLGHSNINMTKKYQHILDNMSNRPAEILNNIVKRKSKDSDVILDVK